MSKRKEIWEKSKYFGKIMFQKEELLQIIKILDLYSKIVLTNTKLVDNQRVSIWVYVLYSFTRKLCY